MATRIDTYFSESDREAIRAATTASEQTTTGEIVVYVVERCDTHPEIGWKCAFLGGAVGALLAVLGVMLFGGWGAPDYLWILLGLQLGLVLGWLLGRFDEIARWMIDPDALASRVAGRAAEAFLEEAVFETKSRTGVLIFVALFEHEVMIIADEGIHRHVGEDAWLAITDEAAAGIRAGDPPGAVIRAVERCAHLLSAHGIVGAGEPNQLSDAPRFRSE